MYYQDGKVRPVWLGPGLSMTRGTVTPHEREYILLSPTFPTGKENGQFFESET
jgi:hypothetical protein